MERFEERVDFARVRRAYDLDVIEEPPPERVDRNHANASEVHGRKVGKKLASLRLADSEEDRELGGSHRQAPDEIGRADVGSPGPSTAS